MAEDRTGDPEVGDHEIGSSRMGKVLIWFVNHDVPALSKGVRVLLGSDIYCRLPPSTVLPHPYGIVMNHATALGERCIILHQVTIGVAHYRERRAPALGDGVYVGAGARVLGDITIGDGAVIGANAVVTIDVPAGRTVVGHNKLLA